ncbi:MAG: DegT/DnrJ/EryC1/StrS family aminotransferase [Clostridia bacterium]|nr:DegT/DnrJ/EryC1/StrS family aminotransferase [Clostridia bacterium]
MPIYVTRSSMPSFEEYCEEIRPLWESRHLTNRGAKHQAFEEKLSAYTECSHVSLFTNGHLALEAALSAYGFEAGSEVITTPFTFASTTHAIVRAGLVPVFCDIDPADYTIDPAKIEELVTEKTVAVLAVHVYGNPCHVHEIEKIAKKHSLKVIYDAAHAFGETLFGKNIAAFGDVSMFSFHATKVFNTIEGGALCTSDEALWRTVECAKNFGLSGEDATLVGTNAKMNEFQAAMGLLNLKHLPEEIARRKAVVQLYREKLGGKDGITLVSPCTSLTENCAYFPVLFDGYKYSRDEVIARLAEQEIYARKYFFPITSEFSCYRYLNPAPTPIAKHVSENILTLPLFADLSLDDAERICKIISD